MKLSPAMLNVLDALFDATCITRGPRMGEVKRRVDADSCYDGRTLSALLRRGLVDFKTGSNLGNGYAVTEYGHEVLIDNLNR